MLFRSASWFTATVWLVVLILGIANETVDVLGHGMALVAIGGGIAVIVLLLRTSAAFDR